jgi:hypothetical protein
MIAALAICAVSTSFNPDSLIRSANDLIAQEEIILSSAVTRTRDVNAFEKEITYTVNGKLLKVEWKVRHERMDKSVTWHFRDGMPFMCRQTWKDTGALAADSLPVDDRFFFSAGRLAAWTDKTGALKDPCSPEYAEIADELPVVAAKLIIRHQ